MEDVSFVHLLDDFAEAMEELQQRPRALVLEGPKVQLRLVHVLVEGEGTRVEEVFINLVVSLECLFLPNLRINSELNHFHDFWDVRELLDEIHSGLDLGGVFGGLQNKLADSIRNQE